MCQIYPLAVWTCICAGRSVQRKMPLPTNRAILRGQSCLCHPLWFWWQWRHSCCSSSSTTLLSILKPLLLPSVFSVRNPLHPFLHSKWFSLSLGNLISFTNSFRYIPKIENFAIILFLFLHILTQFLNASLQVYCGSDDRKTAKGKRFNHSFGNAGSNFCHFLMYKVIE